MFEPAILLQTCLGWVNHLIFWTRKNLINFYRTRTQIWTRKNKNVELKLVKQAELELELKLDKKIDRVRSPGLNEHKF